MKDEFDDPDLVPVFPGITNKKNLIDWNAKELPFPYDSRRTTSADSAFWKRFRTTPRAYVNLQTAQKLWGSPFGKLTSFLIMPVHKGEGGGEKGREMGRKALISTRT